MSRVEVIQQLLQQEPILTSSICIFYEICATSTCTNLCSVCVVRILCVDHSSFMEEKIGERKIRIGVGVVIVVSCLAVCSAIILSDEILTGSIFSLVTYQIKAGGKYQLIPINLKPPLSS